MSDRNISVVPGPFQGMNYPNDPQQNIYSQLLNNLNPQNSAQFSPALVTPRINRTSPQEPAQKITPMIYGRYVDSFDELTIKDIPEDGSLGIFILNDLSQISARQWNSLGSVDEAIFVRQQVQQSTETAPETSMFLAKLDERLGRIEKAVIRNNRPYNKKKKEVSRNDEPSNPDVSK